MLFSNSATRIDLYCNPIARARSQSRPLPAELLFMNDELHCNRCVFALCKQRGSHGLTGSQRRPMGFVGASNQSQTPQFSCSGPDEGNSCVDIVTTNKKAAPPKPSYKSQKCTG